MDLNKFQAANRVWGVGESGTLSELRDALKSRLAGMSASGAVALVGDTGAEAVAAAVWLLENRRAGLVIERARLSPQLEAQLTRCGYTILDVRSGSVVGSDENVSRPAAGIAMLTSGTTGEPKLVHHTWNSIFTMARVKTLSPENWLLTYQPGSYAWWQMVTMCFAFPDQAITIATDRSPTAFIAAARKHRVTAISATPTFWRMAMLQQSAAELAEIPLQRITLGGEPVDQPILDQLRRTFPGASLTHIYASSEAGAAIVVHDGREGFPQSWLTAIDAQPPLDRVGCQVRDNVLWIASPYAAMPGWIDTGDQCHCTGERVLILGRAASAFINVGGAKVPAHEVERVLRLHENVAWCRVSRRKAPFVGELVAAEIVFHAEGRRVVDHELAGFCRTRLPDYMVPRFWTVLPAIPVTANLKTQLAS